MNVPVKYDGEEIEFPVWRIELSKWMKEILTHPELRRELRLDAEQLFRHNGEEFERFINEPWTADNFFDIQVCI